jgi:hypothetical protein
MLGRNGLVGLGVAEPSDAEGSRDREQVEQRRNEIEEETAMVAAQLQTLGDQAT